MAPKDNDSDKNSWFKNWEQRSRMIINFMYKTV